MNNYALEEQKHKVSSDAKVKASKYKEILEKEINNSICSNEIVIKSGPLKGTYQVNKDNINNLVLIGTNSNENINASFSRKDANQRFCLKTVTIGSSKVINENKTIITCSKVYYTNLQNGLTTIKHTTTDIIKSTTFLFNKEYIKLFEQSYRFDYNLYGVSYKSSYSRNRVTFDLSNIVGISDYLVYADEHLFKNELIDFLNSVPQPEQTTFKELDGAIENRYLDKVDRRF